MERTVISSNRQAAYKKDYQEGLNFGYNFLNLVSDVWHNDTVKVCYQYLADGTKWTKRDASGNNGYDYDGSFVYKVQNRQPVFEKATALDVDTYDYGTRMYNADITRWSCADPNGTKLKLIGNFGDIILVLFNGIKKELI